VSWIVAQRLAAADLAGHDAVGAPAEPASRSGAG
jgi:hypothetical protein